MLSKAKIFVRMAVIGGLMLALFAGWLSGGAPGEDAQKVRPRPKADRTRARQVGIETVAARRAATDGDATASPDAHSVAREIDRLLNEEFQSTGIKPAAVCSDEDFLRRVTLDLSGTLPSPSDVTLFGLDPDPAKRSMLIDRLLDGDAYATNWSRYWRDVIFSRATEMRARLGVPTFEAWMAAELKQNRPWNEITTALLTATGDVRENGQTGLLFAQGGDAAELAAETSRIFLGIQIQCANCHDHPTDKWKREQFHQLAAFFPRVTVRPKRDGEMRSFEVVSFDRDQGRRFDPEQTLRRLDRNRDGKLTEAEVKGLPFARLFERLLEVADVDKDKALTLKEMKEAPLPGGDKRPTTEYFMPDLDDPAAEGKKLDPVFFVNSTRAKKGMDDVERREVLARYITSRDNPWFATAYVNRIWAELLGDGFYTPIDDAGPERTPTYPQVLAVLKDGFTASRYDVKWLFRTIANTGAYQRSLASGSSEGQSMPFAAACASRLRSDQLFSSVMQALGFDEPAPRGGDGAMGPMALYRSPRGQFSQLFEFDPSTPRDEIVGEVPQALFMMNSPALGNLIRATGNTRLSRILAKSRDDRDAVTELYLAMLSREPSEKEIKVSLDYVREVGRRNEAFEDLMWALLNSAEFLSKR